MYPILLALIAGLCTGLGALIIFPFKPTKTLMSASMGFASGIMLTLAFTGLLHESMMISYVLAIIGFVLGALLILFLDSLLPHLEFSIFEKGIIDKKMFKTATLIAIGISLHNMTEGLAISAGFYHLPAFGLLVAVSIALHNIPEGIAIALPIISSGGSRKRAFTISFLSGLAEPLGAVIGVALLSSVGGLIPLALAFAAGVMVYLTVDELLPTAQRYKQPHGMGFGIIVGCAVAMLISMII